MKGEIKKLKEKDCNNCEFFSNFTGICKDPEYFVNKYNYKLIVCRYSKDAISFKSVYKNLC